MAVNPSLREALLHVVKNLPAAPAILAQLGELLLVGDADLADAVALLKCDPALTARIVRLANSVMYGAGARAGSLEEALARVGFNEVYRLTGLAALADVSGQNLKLYGITAGNLRENAVLVALMMERIAPSAELDPGTAYTVGLLRGIGRVALDRVVPMRPQREPYSPAQHGPVGEWEEQIAGISNCEAAAVVLEHWRFPRASVVAVREQYCAAIATDRMASALHLVAAQADRCSHGLPGESGYWSVRPEKLAAAGLTEASLAEAMEASLQEFGSIRQVLS